MKRIHQIIIITLVMAFVTTACTNNSGILNEVMSPDGKIKVKVFIHKKQLYYSISREDEEIIAASKLGFKFKNEGCLGNDIRIVGTKINSFNETWEQPWGEKRFIENKYDELIINLQDNQRINRKMDIVFRVFNNGVGFRYIVPKQNGMDSLIITNEMTEFKLPVIRKAWWIPAYKERFYESLYRYTYINQMDTVCIPLTIEAGNGKYIAIHEANLTDYAAMNLYCVDSSTLTCDLTPWSNGDKVRAKTPLYTPWRVILLADSAGDLITNYTILNLNEPSQIEDVSWIKPGKYIGIWWGMHLGKYTWSQGEKHGASTQNAKKYIDFASKNNFNGVLIEGWNYGWDGDWTINGDKFNFTKPYPDFDIGKIANYAASKNIKIIGHHETGGATQNYENQLEDAYRFYNQYGINSVKTGYVSERLDGKEYHTSQYGIRHYRKTIETAAKFKIMIDIHEPVMPTGLQRTYPNLMTQEGVRGQEYDAWSADGGNPPEHTCIVPFTRGLAGPMDFTFGTFNFTNPVHPQTRVQTTIAKQLALYLIIYSPLQMASDLSENYENNKAFEFIKNVSVDWEETRVLKAKIGDYVVIARKDRNSEDWYLGAITDENKREIIVDLSFLLIDLTYQAHIYADGNNANWKTNPLDLKFSEKKVTSKDRLRLILAEGGGTAIRFIPEL